MLPPLVMRLAALVGGRHEVVSSNARAHEHFVPCEGMRAATGHMTNGSCAGLWAAIASKYHLLRLEDPEKRYSPS
jgi:hypothetical protein